ncbi:PstS family phosphate ABC transporter substrate-binding protein [Streptomyces sp. NPDC058001]|uniref:PstS family phosphate ABC transporter substrate-binding protein n=1 Tax=Streptomyces sp. NPDC058001 TaxID=3346300 RepID=UPI0036E2E512
MEWLSAENVVAVGTAVLGVLTSVAVLWYELRVPRRKRIGYRVQLDTPVGREAHDGRANVRRGWFADVPGMEDATLVLLRIENDGSQSIDEDDYRRRELHGLEVVLTDRTIKGLVVSVPRQAGHLMGHFTETAGLRYEGSELCVPRVPLNRGEHFKLLMLLSGGGVGRPIRIEGGIKDGEVKPNRSTTPDDKPPLFSRAARVITVLLTACVVVLATIIVVRDDRPPPMGCARGTLTVTGSTAFRPVLLRLADRYEKECAGSTVTVDTHGSTAGIRGLVEKGAAAKGSSPAVVALSDGPAPSGYAELQPTRVAVSVFTLVVNDDVTLTGLTLDQVRRLYRGEITNWRELDGPNLAVRLVSRDANSGTRQVFQRRVLQEGEPANTSLDCVHRDNPGPDVVRCELEGTEQVLAMVARLPGAVGYSELRATDGVKGLHALRLDGNEPSLDALRAGDTDGYPYREIEYAYTYHRPPADSLAASFVAFMSRGTGQDVIRDLGHLPCATPEGLRICGEEN